MNAFHRLSHHLLHRMPYSLAAEPGGGWLVVGGSAAGAMRGCGGAVLGRDGGGGWLWAADEAGTEVADGFRLTSLASAEGMGMLLRERRVEVVFAPFFGGGSAAERRALSALVESLGEARGWAGEIWCYETTVPLWPNRGIDISDRAAQKRELLSRCRGSDVAQGLGRYRGLRPMVPAAEAFVVLARRAFLRECRRWAI